VNLKLLVPPLTCDHLVPSAIYNVPPITVNDPDILVPTVSACVIANLLKLLPQLVLGVYCCALLHNCSKRIEKDNNTKFFMYIFFNLL